MVEVALLRAVYPNHRLRLSPDLYHLLDLVGRVLSNLSPLRGAGYTPLRLVRDMFDFLGAAEGKGGGLVYYCYCHSDDDYCYGQTASGRQYVHFGVHSHGNPDDSGRVHRVRGADAVQDDTRFHRRLL